MQSRGEEGGRNGQDNNKLRGIIKNQKGGKLKERRVRIDIHADNERRRKKEKNSRRTDTARIPVCETDDKFKDMATRLQKEKSARKEETAGRHAEKQRK